MKKLITIIMMMVTIALTSCQKEVIEPVEPVEPPKTTYYFKFTSSGLTWSETLVILINNNIIEHDNTEFTAQSGDHVKIILPFHLNWWRIYIAEEDWETYEWPWPEHQMIQSTTTQWENNIIYDEIME